MRFGKWFGTDVVVATEEEVNKMTRDNTLWEFISGNYSVSPISGPLVERVEDEDFKMIIPLTDKKKNELMKQRG